MRAQISHTIKVLINNQSTRNVKSCTGFEMNTRKRNRYAARCCKLIDCHYQKYEL